jgi:hypothetical protein
MALIEAEIGKVLMAADLGIKINGIIFGAKLRSGSVNPPQIWVRPVATPIDDETMGLSEYWRSRYVVIGMVKDLNPTKGFNLARELALKASAEFVKTSDARHLNNLCDDIVRTGLIPVYDNITDDGAIHGAGVSIEIRFDTKEA